MPALSPEVGRAMARGYRTRQGIPENALLSGDGRLWVQRVLDEYIWSKQQEIIQSVQTHRYTAVQSCHDSGKSYIASRIGCWWLDTRPDPFLVTTAPTWKQVNAILWREMRKAHNKGNLRGRINLDAEWYYGADELVAFGRKPADYDQSAFQGIHALNVMVLIDEACGVPQTIFDAADALATNKRARVLAIGNPDDPASYFEQICRPGSGWNVIKISAFDTPAFTEEEVPDYLYDLLVSEEWVDERKKRWGEGSPLYTSKVLGEFPDISDDTVFTPKMIREAQEREIVPNLILDKGQLGADIARYGEDETAIYHNNAGRVRLIKAYHKADTMETANVLASIMNQYPDEVVAAIDVVGVGAGVFDRVREMGLPAVPFNSSERPRDPVRFANRRAEAWWTVREMAERGELDLPPAGVDDDLIAQLLSVKWKITTGGKIILESKDDMKLRGLPSPDRADAAVMALVRASTIQAFAIPDAASTPTSGLKYRPM